MKLNLKKQVLLKGWSSMYGVSHKQIKARSLTPNNNVFTKAIDYIKETEGYHYMEYRLVYEKEKREFVWRCTLSDCGINGGHSTIKKAVASIVGRFELFIDEAFSYSELSEFKELKKVHKFRGFCKHPYAVKKTHFTDIKSAMVCPQCKTTYNIID